ncbi:MAG: GDP-mannose 4,6-dehydratase [bacterium]|uniref:GDP-D-mannose dehydratase n=2 Tax=Bacteria candidate phyla TaxID=1783234 RepID=A0A101I2M1_UNCT6|nr:MAG: GDP-D-mannose dehydratase [candidate division TA06 bacterium 32_111]KUK87254.1 MAG: GDP-D-mannose dehydratase [candidate division TA06 bacterium 34_109]MDI6700488.1 GDP-mannose 4,6-dehydratase [bacterium]HAF07612.1 GDP-mannose 4,6 dehydratase [candidate division WOR-3 bacterium]HCP16163.1 GDP-mannose 4,6 dehydratase [candidate division WOR-3 bacterium]
MKKVLITGAEGFVASYLYKILKEKYDVEGTYLVEKDLGYTSYKLDLTDKKSVFEFFEKNYYDFIFHLAGQSSTRVSLKNPYLTYNVNINSTLNIIESLRSYQRKTKFIFISTSDVYGIPKYLPIDEKHPVNPQNPYSISKKICEDIIQSYEMFGLNYIIIRAFNHIGVGQNENFFIPSLVRKIKETQDGKVKVGNLNLKRDFTDVRDMVYAYSLAMELKNGIYNICSGKSYSLKYIADYLAKLSGKKITFEIDGSLLRKNEPEEFLGSMGLFKSITGYRNRYSLEETLKWIFDNYDKTDSSL